MANRWGNSGWLYFGGSKITADGDCSHEIKRCLLLGRKVMTNLDSILKSRDITLSTKVRIVKAILLPVVIYRCESWTIKKAKHRGIDAFELWCWRRLLRVPWTAGRSCLLFNHSQDFRLFKNTYWVVVSSNSIPIPDSSPTACMPAVYWSCVQLIHQEWGKEKRIWQGASTLTGVFADIVSFAHFPLAQPYPRPHTYFTPSRNPSTPLAMGLQPISLNSTSQCGLVHFISIVIWKSARGHQGNIA